MKVVLIIAGCLVVLVSSINCEVFSRRRLSGRAFPIDPGTPSKCLNTVQGRWLVTDDQGKVCKRQELDSRSGCCTTGEQFSCSTCSVQDECCSSYEYCVSCCQRADMNAQDLFKIRYRSAGRPETGYWKNAFEYCRGLCRPNSNTTVHENAYLSDSHFCFSASGKPFSPGPQRPTLPDEITVVSGEAGQSCTQACQTKNQRCSEEHLKLLNNCNWLRDHFGCEAGCETDSDMQGFERPAYVSQSAIKKDNPSMCLLSEATGEFGFSCEAKRQNTLRLCACAPIPVQ